MLLQTETTQSSSAVQAVAAPLVRAQQAGFGTGLYAASDEPFAVSFLYRSLAELFRWESSTPVRRLGVLSLEGPAFRGVGRISWIDGDRRFKPEAMADAASRASVDIAKALKSIVVHRCDTSEAVSAQLDRLPRTARLSIANDRQTALKLRPLIIVTNPLSLLATDDDFRGPAVAQWEEWLLRFSWAKQSSTLFVVQDVRQLSPFWVRQWNRIFDIAEPLSGRIPAAMPSPLIHRAVGF